jgi:hypothetical protein
MFNWISSVLTWDTYHLSCSAFQQNIGTKWELSHKCKWLNEKGLEQYPPIYDSWQGQVVKHISAVTPGIWVSIFSLALVIKAIHLAHTKPGHQLLNIANNVANNILSTGSCFLPKIEKHYIFRWKSIKTFIYLSDLSAFMVTPQQCHVPWIPALHPTDYEKLGILWANVPHQYWQEAPNTHDTPGIGRSYLALRSNKIVKTSRLLYPRSTKSPCHHNTSPQFHQLPFLQSYNTSTQIGCRETPIGHKSFIIKSKVIYHISCSA